ncbi:probable ribosomal RNA processing protein 1 homolog B at N-terminal half [Coccomyxa sp. Obi]|nr:probable ribosomal RNA processing protein 1 homolog B at N-terminal half [Coccomyxa sp. Obi]
MCEMREQGEAVTGRDRPVKAKKLKKVLEPVSIAEDGGGNCKFARALGSVDWHTREQGLQALTIWLTRTSPSEADLTKIWKALFFCFWHSDKAHVQAELAERLAAILPMMSREGAQLYFKVFAKTMQREWFGIDKLRLDKFMMLVRKFLHQLFIHLQEGRWDSERTAAYCAFLLDDVFMKSDREPSAGFSLHLADIAVSELCEACDEAGPVPTEALQALLEPFCLAAAHTKRPALLARLQDGVFGELLQTGNSGALANMDMRALAARLFDLGAQPEVRARNREVLYALSKLFERAEAKRQKRSHEAASNPVAVHSSVPRPAQPADATPATAEVAASSDAGAQASSKQNKKQKRSGGPSASELPRSGLAELPAVSTPTTAARPALPNGKKRKGASDEEGKAAASEAGGTSGQLVQKAAAVPTAEATVVQNGQAGAQSTGKKRKKSMAALVAEAAAMKAGRSAGGAEPAGVATPVAAGREALTSALASAAAEQVTQSQLKKQVKFSMKNNLYFEKGGPIPPAEVRTPPTAKPKGSALKKTSSVSARPKSPRVSAGLPKKRAKAALFFK